MCQKDTYCVHIVLKIFYIIKQQQSLKNEKEINMEQKYEQLPIEFEEDNLDNILEGLQLIL